MSSGNLDKYEYLTDEDLNYKPSTVDLAKFDYSPLSKFFNRGLKEEETKEGLLKRIKNIEDKNKEQLKAIKVQGKRQSDSKDNKTVGSKSFLIYDSRHGFYKYRFSKFVKISSVVFKVDALEIFYKAFIDLKDVDVKPENTIISLLY